MRQKDSDEFIIETYSWSRNALISPILVVFGLLYVPFT